MLQSHSTPGADAPPLTLFDAMPASLWEAVDRIKEVRSYAEGALVHGQGERVEGAFLLLDGEWKLLHEDGRGYQQVIEFLRPGAITGLTSYFEHLPSPFAVRSLRRSRGAFIPGSAFRAWALSDPAGVDALMRHFGSQVRDLMEVAHGLSLQTVPERLAKVLLAEQMRKPDSPLLEFQEDQGELGQHIGCTRAAVSRGFKLLGEMGLIRNSFPVVRVLDLPRLQRIAGLALAGH